MKVLDEDLKILHKSQVTLLGLNSYKINSKLEMRCLKSILSLGGKWITGLNLKQGNKKADKFERMGSAGENVGFKDQRFEYFWVKWSPLFKNWEEIETNLR